MAKKRARKPTKDFGFSRFFNPSKSSSMNKHPKAIGTVVWPAHKGTYVRAIHGELPNA